MLTFLARTESSILMWSFSAEFDIESMAREGFIVNGISRLNAGTTMCVSAGQTKQWNTGNLKEETHYSFCVGSQVGAQLYTCIVQVQCTTCTLLDNTAVNPVEVHNCTKSAQSFARSPA